MLQNKIIPCQTWRQGCHLVGDETGLFQLLYTTLNKKTSPLTVLWCCTFLHPARQALSVTVLVWFPYNHSGLHAGCLMYKCQSLGPFSLSARCVIGVQVLEKHHAVFPPMQYGYLSRMEKFVHCLDGWGCNLNLGHIVLLFSCRKDLIEMLFTMLFIYDGCGEVQNIFPEGKEIAFAFPPCVCL